MERGERAKKKRNKKWEGEERKRLKRCKAAGNGGEKGAEDRRQEGKLRKGMKQRKGQECGARVKVTSVMPSSLRPTGLKPDRLFCPWNFPGKNTGVDRCALLQGIFLTQGWTPPSPALARRVFTRTATWEAPGRGICQLFIRSFRCQRMVREGEQG